MIYAKVSERTKEQLQDLAGSPRKVGAYLDKIVPVLVELQADLDEAMEEAQRELLVAALAKMQAKREAQ